MRIFDTHCHINSEEYDNILEEVINRAHNQNVSDMMIIGTDLNSSKKAIEIATKYDNLYASIGIFLTDLARMKDNDLEELEKLAIHKKVKAVGEVGLDYHYDEINKEQQKEYFVYFLKLANKYHLPVIIHTRDADLDTLTILKENKNLLQDGGIMHCFSGSKEMAKEYIKLGFYISFAGPITFKNADRTREVVQSIPLDRLLVETDSPYLTPVPFRGKMNEPKNTYYTLEMMAKLHNLSIEEMASITYNNSLKVFKIYEEN